MRLLTIFLLCTAALLVGAGLGLAMVLARLQREQPRPVSIRTGWRSGAGPFAAGMDAAFSEFTPRDHTAPENSSIH